MAETPFLAQLRQLNRDLNDVSDRRRKAERDLIVAVRSGGPAAFESKTIQDRALTIQSLHEKCEGLRIEQKALRAKVHA